jgi:hypothetical protein
MISELKLFLLLWYKFAAASIVSIDTVIDKESGGICVCDPYISSYIVHKGGYRSVPSM